MTSAATTVESIHQRSSRDRREALHKIRNIILENLPESFQGRYGLWYDWIFCSTFIYPQGYHCNPKQKLYLSWDFAKSRKTVSISITWEFMLSLKLYDWFVTEYQNIQKQN